MPEVPRYPAASASEDQADGEVQVLGWACILPGASPWALGELHPMRDLFKENAAARLRREGTAWTARGSLTGTATGGRDRR